MLSNRDYAGEEFWKKQKADYDELMAYRRSIKGKPDIYQKAQLELNQIWIDHYNRTLFHRYVSYCDCKGCIERKEKARQMYERQGKLTP